MKLPCWGRDGIACLTRMHACVLASCFTIMSAWQVLVGNPGHLAVLLQVDRCTLQLEGTATAGPVIAGAAGVLDFPSPHANPGKPQAATIAAVLCCVLGCMTNQQHNMRNMAVGLQKKHPVSGAGSSQPRGHTRHDARLASRTPHAPFSVLCAAGPAVRLVPAHAVWPACARALAGAHVLEGGSPRRRAALLGPAAGQPRHRVRAGASQRSAAQASAPPHLCGKHAM